MKFKIGNKIYNSKECGPLMIILTEKDKENIKNMPPSCTRYCEFPDGKHSEREIEEFMDLKNSEIARLL